MTGREGTRRLALVMALVLAPQAAQASWWKSIFGARDRTEQQQETGERADNETTAPLSGNVIESGLRTALLQGTRAAVAHLGRLDGFWENPEARIPLPAGLQGTADLISRVGGRSAVERFQLTLNRAAEQAVPEAAEVMTRAVRDMTLVDVRDILAGGEDAATRYFRGRTETELQARFRPIVAQSVQQAGVGNAYHAMVQSAGPFAGALGAPDDLEGYVTARALDALYQRVAVEEAAIRRDPAGRGSEILEQVFGRR